jgi:cold shock CspA family protein
MEIPIRVDYRNVRPTAIIEKRIRRKAAKLDRIFNRITACRVTVEGPDSYPRKGGQFTVRLDLTVPGQEIVISRRHAENLAVAVREAFEAAQRKLEDYSRIRRNNVKQRKKPPEGRVVRLFPEDGYGFIDDGAGREIYFHRNSVLSPGFDGLEVGYRVRYSEEQGNDGPQASTVSILS